MDIHTIGLVLTLFCIFAALLVNIYCNFRIIQISTTQLAVKLEELNQAVGEAVGMVVEMNPSEPPNPIHAILARIMEAQLEPKKDVKVIPAKDSKGQFTSETI